MMMQWLLAAGLVCVWLPPVIAGELRIFFATTGAAEDAPLTVIPAFENPQVMSGEYEYLYIYAQMYGGPEAWNGVSLNIDVRGGGTIESWQFYDYANDAFQRWDFASDGTLGHDDTRVSNAYGVAYLDGFGVQNDPQWDALDEHYVREADVTLLGRVRVAIPGPVDETEVFLGVGGLGITKAGTSLPQDVYLGFDDDNDGLTGESYDEYSSLADATIVNGCVVFMLADANCDGVLNAFDIDPFALGLADPSDYADEFPECNRRCVCDINRDGDVNAFDIDPFVQCLSGSCP